MMVGRGYGDRVDLIPQVRQHLAVIAVERGIGVGLPRLSDLLDPTVELFVSATKITKLFAIDNVNQRNDLKARALRSRNVGDSFAARANARQRRLLKFLVGQRGKK